MRKFFLQPVDDVLAGLEAVVRVKNPVQALAPPLISILVIWFLYVPIHELLHVWGCVITGGRVDRLEMSPIYGASLYAKIFPFIHSGSDYAGQLTDFETNGSDFCYLVTVFMPYMMTVLFGVAFMKWSRRRRRPVLFGLGVVIGLAPFYNIPGDYYEMASTITTRMVTMLRGTEEQTDSENGPQDDNSIEEDGKKADTIAYEGIRSDDVFKLWSQVFTEPGELGLSGRRQITISVVLIVLSMGVSVLLAFSTYWVGHCVSRWLVRSPAAGEGSTGST